MKKKLSNGLEVTYIKSNSKKTMFSIIVKAGASDEKEGQAGIAHLLEHSVFRRTENLETDFLKFVRKNSLNYNAFTDNHVTVYFAEGLKTKFEKCVELVKDVVLLTKFTKEDVDKEREIVRTELNTYCKTYEEHINFSKEFYNCNKKYSVIGYEKDVMECSYEEIKKFYETYYTLGNMELLIIGNLKKKELDENLELLEKEFGYLIYEQTDLKKRKEDINFKNIIKEKTEGNRDYYYILKNKIFNNKKAAIKRAMFEMFLKRKLNDYIREEKAYCYSISSYKLPTYKEDVGIINAEVPFNLDPELILSEIKKVLTELTNELTEDKFKMIKQSFLESSELFGDCEKNYFFLQNEVKNYETTDRKRKKTRTRARILKEIKEITLEDIKEIYEEYKKSKVSWMVL